MAELKLDKPRMPARRRKLRVRQRLGKYRIERVVGEGGFATVYGARDTVEGIPVALKVFHGHDIDAHALEAFRAEARVHARLDHPNILPIKDANFIEDQFVIVTRLGEGTLADRLAKRMSVRLALHLAHQMLAALDHTHANRVIHLDVKPENFILFPGDVVKLTDFGIARFATRTMPGSGSGTVGFCAPEQAMGRPSYRSDVFSVGLILWRMFGGRLPTWPFDWPPEGYDKIRRTLHRDLVEFLKRSIAVKPAERFQDCTQMFEAFEGIEDRALRSDAARRGKRKAGAGGRAEGGKGKAGDWREVRWKQCKREFGGVLPMRSQCGACKGPVAESMQSCPWCAHKLVVPKAASGKGRRCKRCRRGMNADWRFCAYCYGPKQEPTTKRQVADKRYSARCANSACGRKAQFPFMRYCPWCRSKVQRAWKIVGHRQRCGHCGWGVLRNYWRHCPWCSKKLTR